MFCHTNCSKATHIFRLPAVKDVWSRTLFKFVMSKGHRTFHQSANGEVLITNMSPVHSVRIWVLVTILVVHFHARAIIISFSPKLNLYVGVFGHFDLWFDLHSTSREFYDCSSIREIMMYGCREHVKFDQLRLMAIDPALSKHSDTNNDNGCPLFAFDQDANNCLEFMKSFLSPEYWPDRCSSKYNCCHLGCTYNCFNLKSHISYNLGSKFIHFLDEKALNANASSNVKIMKLALISSRFKAMLIFTYLA